MRILHITDIHAGWSQDEAKEQAWWDRVCEAIVTELKKAPVDMVAATGDFCKMGSRWEFSRALTYLNQLKERTGLKASQFSSARATMMQTPRIRVPPLPIMRNSRDSFMGKAGSQSREPW